jgi:hypothetical protein
LVVQKKNKELSNPNIIEIRKAAFLWVLAFLSACGGSSGGSSPPPPPPPANTAPVVNAGADATIQLPEDSVALDATVTDDGLPSNTLTYTWSVSSGPAGATFADASAEDTTVTFVDAGTYVLELTASDSALQGSDTVQVTVEPAVVVNNPPTANSQSVSTPEDTPASITLTGTDPDGDSLTFAIGTGPTSGTLSGTAPNVTYTPNANFSGADSFTFTVNDGTVDSAAATVSITVTAANDAPTADPQSVSTAEDTALPITLTGSDPDGDALTFAIATQPTNGTLSGTAPNVTYTPNADFNGADSFTFTVNDGTVDSAAATVSITVTAANDAPTADAQPVSTDEDVPVDITLTGSDPDGDALTFAIATGPTSGTLSGTLDGDELVTYTPNAGFTGADSFTFTVNDGTQNSAPATVSITVQVPGVLGFTDITLSAGTAGPDIGGHGVMFADVDDDGLPDLYLTNNFSGTGERPDFFFRNQGGSSFADESVLRGIDDADGGSHGAAWADLDNDGDYDLINGTTWSWNGSAGGDFGFPDHNNVYRNDLVGPGVFGFTDVTAQSIQDVQIETRAFIAFDFEGDGDLDLFGIPGSQVPGVNEAFLNNFNGGAGTAFDFTEYPEVGELKTAIASQGAIDTDIDDNGVIDAITANRGAVFQFLVNNGSGVFDAQDQSVFGIADDAGDGITAADADNDGDLDLLLVSDGTGELYFREPGTYVHQRTFSGVEGYMGGFADLDNDGDLDLVFAGDNEVFLNDGFGTFTAGPSLPTVGINDPRAVAFADIDNDGDLDFAFAAKRSRNWLIRNDFDGGRWLKVRLVSPQGMAGAFGAKTRIYRAGEAGQPGSLLGMRESRSNYGYLGQDDPVLHFGLGSRTSVDVVVTFPDGTVITRHNVSANQTIRIEPPFE